MGLINFERPKAVQWTHFLRPFAMLADLLYPPACAACGVMTADHRGLCPKCWSGVRFIERPYCEVLGLPFSHDLGAGILSAEAIANPPPFDRLRSVATHDHAVRDLVHGLKYRDRTDLAPMMADWMLRASDGMIEACDALVPVPLHRGRMLSRKFNQAAELARHIARLSGKPLVAGHIAAHQTHHASRSDSAQRRARTMCAALLQSPRAGKTMSSASVSFWSTTSIRPARPSVRQRACFAGRVPRT